MGEGLVWLTTEMRLIRIALVAGFALGFALLGIGEIPSATSLTDNGPSGAASRSAVVASIPVSPVASLLPGAHSDGNTASLPVGEQAGLNPNLIAGRSTTICLADTAETSIQNALTIAVERWNQAFMADIGYNIFTLVQGSLCNTAQIRVFNETGTACRFDTNTFGMFARTFDAGDASARFIFESSCGSGTRYHSDSYIPLILHTNNITRNDGSLLGTLMHELGHAAGVDHYDTDSPGACGKLRRTPPTPPTPTLDMPTRMILSAPIDVDRNDDHWTTMGSGRASYGECRTELAVTGRDRRDFYEAYRVGAVKNVTVKWPTTRTDQSRTLEWTKADISEMAHNADEILVLRRTGSTAPWTVATRASIWEDDDADVKEAMMDITLQADAMRPSSYMIVGLSGAGVKGLPLASLASTTYTPNSTAGFTPWSDFVPGAATTAGTEQRFRGDPSYLEGPVWANTEPSSAGVILNASLNSTNCYLTGSSAARFLRLYLEAHWWRC